MNIRTILTTTIMALSGIGMNSCVKNHIEEQVVNTPLSSEETDKKVDEIYARMTQEERLAQLQSMYLSDLFDKDNNLDTAKCRQLIPNGIGHFAQYASASPYDVETLRLMVFQVQNWIMTNTNAKIPALFHEEVLTGVAARGATVYPQQIGQACSFNTELAERKTQQTARLMRDIGGYLALSPMVDVVRNPYFNRLEESYGEDAYLSAAMGTAFVKGLQNGGLGKGIAACSKHFLGYGGGGDTEDKELMEEILLPHEVMIRVGGSKVVMTGYHKFRGTQCIASSALMQDILRGYLKFDGVMVSDYFSIRQNEAEKDSVHQAAAAINAGNDIDFPIIATYAELPKAIEQGLVSEQTFETAVKRVLMLKAAVGLLDENPVFGKIEGGIDIDTKEERETAYEIAAQSVVLLKNNGILPLKGNNRIALVGPNANSMWAMLGDYTYHGMEYFWKQIVPSSEEPHIVTLKEAMYDKLPADMSIDYACGCDWTGNIETTIATSGDERAKLVCQKRRIERDEVIDIDHALKIASESDVIIAAMGENDLLSGENRNRGGLRLPGKQEEFVNKLVATGKPVVLVMFGGRAQVIGDLAIKCAAVLQSWYPGEEGGNAVADILYGNVNPSGKLSVSYPKVELNEPICYNNSLEQDPRIQYPFGFGKSYTTYSYKVLEYDKKVNLKDIQSNVAFEVEIEVSNKGDMDGEEIVQIYLSPKSENIKSKLKPIKLIGFARVPVKAGKSTKEKVLISPQLLGYYEDGQWAIEPGEYEIKIGASSQDIKNTLTVTLSGDKVTMPLRTVYFSEITKK